MKLTGYKQKFKRDCGCAEISALTGIPYDKVVEKFPGTVSDDTVFADLYDMILQHYNILKSLGIPFRVVDDTEILSGKCEEGKTAILIHALDDKETIIPEDIIYQHYVILANVNSISISLEWGDGSCKTFSHDNFLKMYRGRPIRAAYTISGPDLRKTLTFKESALLWLYNKWISLLERLASVFGVGGA